MKKISLGLLCELLQHALARMMDLNGVEPFINPVDRKEFPDYDKYVVHPMDLNLIKQNITKGLYGSTEAFLADVQWILHNSMSLNIGSGQVDVRFFGAHDRAWVPAKDCFLYSEKDPNNFRTKRQDLLDSIQEAEDHIRNISKKFGKFVHPPFKTQFEPSKLNEQIKLMVRKFNNRHINRQADPGNTVLSYKLSTPRPLIV
ncbi:unnamed protein product [Leptidea sinapis]|uniref:Bromo domain-containing protein n=1 Tax=Leptidea sinapis TaxID=189913 RepID=A0A5E4QWU1_9NEOP|nr:unnamed protein product [Leptidea sinapis]